MSDHRRQKFNRDVDRAIGRLQEVRRRFNAACDDPFIPRRPDDDDLLVSVIGERSDPTGQVAAIHDDFLELMASRLVELHRDVLGSMLGRLSPWQTPAGTQRPPNVCQNCGRSPSDSRTCGACRTRAHRERQAS